MGGARTVAVVLLGAVGSGKSTLAAALLAAAGGQAPVGGPDRLAAGMLSRDGVDLWLLDPPGAPDLAGELAAGLRPASAALLVVSPTQGLDRRTLGRWEALAGLPRLVVLSQLDRPGADTDEAEAVLRRVLGEQVVALQQPLHEQDGAVAGLLDLLDLQVRVADERRPADPEHVALTAGLRDDLLTAVLTGSEDDELFGRWLAGEQPSGVVLLGQLTAAVGRGEVQPVLLAAPRRGVGLEPLLDLLVRLPRTGAPPPVRWPDGSPADVLPGDAAGPLLAEGIRDGLLRVWSGRLRPGAPVLVAGLPATYDGPAAEAGQLVRAGTLVGPGQRVTAPGEDLLLADWAVPPAQFPVGVRPGPALAARVLADPAARLSDDGGTLWAYGPRHAEVLLAGLPALAVVVPADAPPVRVRVHLPAWAVPAVRSDLTGRGGQVGTQRVTDDGVALDAVLPAGQLPGYPVALAHASADTGWFERLDDTA